MIGLTSFVGGFVFLQPPFDNESNHSGAACANFACDKAAFLILQSTVGR